MQAREKKTSTLRQRLFALGYRFSLTISEQRKCRDPIYPFRSLITSRTPPPMSSTAQLALIAKSYTLVKQDDDQVTGSENTLESNDKDASKPVARHFNLPYHSKKHMAVCGLSLHLESSETRKTSEQKFIFQIGTLNLHSINERFSFNYFILE